MSATPNSIEPNSSEESSPEREVVTRTTVTIETRTSTKRWFYQGMSEADILEYERTQEVDNVLEEFAKDVESTPKENLTIVRTVTIEDKR